MGLIQDLVQQRHAKERQNINKELEGYQFVLTNPDATPEAHEWALTNALKVSGLIGKSDKGGKGDHVKDAFKGIASVLSGGALFPAKGPKPDEWKGGTGQGGGQGMFMSPEQKEQQQNQAASRGIETRKGQYAQAGGKPGEAQTDYALSGTLPTQYGNTTRAIGTSGKPTITKIPNVTNPDTKQPATLILTTNPDGTTSKSYEDTSKGVSGKPETAQQIHLEAYAQKLGKRVEDLTPMQKEDAITKAKRTVVQGTKMLEAAGATGYIPGGASKANPKGDMQVDVMAWEFINTGHLPFTGMGKNPKRDQALARAGEVLADLGISPAELPAVRANLKANSQSLARITTLGSMTQQFEGTVQKNIQLAQRLSQQYARTRSPFINRIKAGIQYQFGDPAVNNFNLQMQTLATEYARVMGGGTNSAGTKISDKEDAIKFINGYLSQGQLDGLFSTMQSDMDNRTQAIAEEKQSLLQAIRGNVQGVQGAGTPNKSTSVKSNGASGSGVDAGKALLPKPKTPGQRISLEDAEKFVKAAGGDKQKARELAKTSGWSF